MSLPNAHPNNAVVITGASSGIGQEIARGLGRRSYPLVLVARRQDRLDQLADELRQRYSVNVDVMPLDLNEGAARATLVERIEDESIAGLVNSAGFGTSGPFHSLPPQREREQVVVNALALMELTRAALPGMIDRGAGAVLNVGSIAGFQPLPGAAVYAATKAFVQTFSEAVHEELRGTGVSCTLLSPGPVPTEWWEIAGEGTPGGVAQVSPKHVADSAIAGMLKGKRSVIPGLVPKAAGFGGRFMPRWMLLPALRTAAERRK